MKKKIIVSSLLSIAMCSSLVVGSTYAIFTSESKVNVAVISGTVKVEANVTETTYSHDDRVSANTDCTYEINEDGGVDVERMLPGDTVTAKVEIENQSNVAIQYQISTSVTGGLAGYLDITGVEKYWTFVEAGADIVSEEIVISLPYETVNSAQDQSATVTILVKAVQGNGVVQTIVSEDDFDKMDFSKENTNYVLEDKFAGKDIVITELGENSTLLFKDTAPNSITLGQLKTSDSVATLAATEEETVNPFIVTFDNVTPTEGITMYGSHKIVGENSVVGKGLSVQGNEETPAVLLIEDANVKLDGGLEVKTVNDQTGETSLTIKNSNVTAQSAFIGGHSNNQPYVTAEFNVYDSYLGFEENNLGSTISVWGQAGVKSKIYDSEIHTYSRGWHQSEDANDNSITFQSGVSLAVELVRSNFHLYGARSIINARKYGTSGKEFVKNCTIEDCLIWVVTKSNHGEQTIPVWDFSDIKDTVLIFAKNVYNNNSPAVISSWVYGNPVIEGDFNVVTQCGWATDVVLTNGQTVTFERNANVTTYDGAAEVNFVLEAGASVVVKAGAVIKNIGFKAVEGATLQTATVDGATVYTAK